MLTLAKFKMNEVIASLGQVEDKYIPFNKTCELMYSTKEIYVAIT